MKHLLVVVPFILVTLVPKQIWADSRVKNSKAIRQEISVKLFGQNCKLSGPIAGKDLQTIHQISPEQIQINDLSQSASKELLEKIQGLSSVPQFLSHYKEKLIRRLMATVAYYQGLNAFKTTGKIEALTGAVDVFIEGKQSGQFKTLLKSLETKEKLIPWSQGSLDQIKENYFLKLGGLPEQEFHRAIEKNEVFYTCAFEETETDQSGTE